MFFFVCDVVHFVVAIQTVSVNCNFLNCNRIYLCMYLYTYVCVCVCVFVSLTLVMVSGYK